MGTRVLGGRWGCRELRGGVRGDLGLGRGVRRVRGLGVAGGVGLRRGALDGV